MSYLATRAKQETSHLMSSDFKELVFAAKKLANHSIMLGASGFGVSVFEWVASFAAMLSGSYSSSNCLEYSWLGFRSIRIQIFIDFGQNKLENKHSYNITNPIHLLESSLGTVQRLPVKIHYRIVPQAFLRLLEINKLFWSCSGDIGKWIAFVAVVLRLFFPRRFPGASWQGCRVLIVTCHAKRPGFPADNRTSRVFSTSLAGITGRFDSSNRGGSELILEHAEKQLGWCVDMPCHCLLPSSRTHQGIGWVSQFIHESARDIEHGRHYSPVGLSCLGFDR
ncbi:hypothetical protein F3Y22_tig00117048pilonHSYRG00170 [Hibiscus syriacus]|uniref:Uncharacterized protein n=1 Tax=Hibiscus syriacus TaxID=106335 RepID=A0A6A2WLT1_HIBSY|nr:hypothetical protein F3Y22_tig00117048pilonHSYRG00170 [Hibiscus syriacus]